MTTISIPNVQRNEIAVEAPAAALQGTLLLGDGTLLEGRGIGEPGMVAAGELVFTTAMTGYQEALTDPSYAGQLLLFTTPLLGTYGMASHRVQSSRLHPAALLCAHYSPSAAASPSLLATLSRHHLPLLTDLDTRRLTHHLRSHGSLPAALLLHPLDTSPALPHLQQAIDSLAYDATDYISTVTPTHPRVVGAGSRSLVLLDCGTKEALVSQLVQRDCQVTLLPATTAPEDILALRPDGVVLSNGPGNPETATDVIATIRLVLGRVPLFGICLGHQLLALAAGGRTSKLPFGHRGANHPVIEVGTGRGVITTQNHGYAVDEDSLPDEFMVSHRHLHDGTVEGLVHRELPVRSVQFHPEGAPGPKDAAGILDDWLDLLPA